MIEAVHGIRIVNCDALADTLARAAGDRTQASRATAALKAGSSSTTSGARSKYRTT
jgi:hypothetical protein